MAESEKSRNVKLGRKGYSNGSRHRKEFDGEKKAKSRTFHRKGGTGEGPGGPPPGFAAIGHQSAPPNICVICCCQSNLFSIGKCLHPVCIECSTRMRVLGQSKLCSYCRLELPKIYYVTLPHNGNWDDWSPQRRPAYNKYGIAFENEDTFKAFNDFLAHVCTVCSNEPEFSTFKDLRRHMSREHELFYCDLCTEHLQLFSWERKYYSRKNLAVHRRHGDGDDRSYKGHPECRFCLYRFLDDDHLFRHMRQDHFYCHFCDTDGDQNTFYNEYGQLRLHYKNMHYLCEEGACKNEPHGVVFRTEIDLKVHKAKTHRSGKQVVQVEFTLADRPESEGYSRRRGGGARGRPFRNANVQLKDYKDIPRENGAIVDHNTGKSGKVQSVCQIPTDESAISIVENGSKFEVQNEDFPTLLKYAQNCAPAQNFAPEDIQNWGRTQTGKLRRHKGSLDESEYPTLSQERNKSLHTNNNNNNTKPASSREPSNVQSDQYPKRIFAVIDDNESFPSLTSESRILREMRQLADCDKSKLSRAHQSLTDGLQGRWGIGAVNDLAQAASCLQRQDALTSLNDNYQKTQWNKKLFPVAEIINQRTTGNKKQSQLAVPDIWPQGLRVLNEQNDPGSNVQGHMVKLESSGQRVRRVGRQPSSGQQQPARESNNVSDVLVAEKSAEGKFCKPDNFDGRNKDLLRALQKGLSDRELNVFNTSSRQFQQGQMDANAYLQLISPLLAAHLTELMPELICLLPNIPLQHSLLTAYALSQMGVRPKQNLYFLKIGPVSFRLCPDCTQVLADTDYAAHMNMHQENDSLSA